MSNLAETKTAGVSAVETDIGQTVSIRVSPNAYFSALFFTTFFSALLVYLEYDLAAILLFAGSWIFFPVCLWTDKIVFDGKRLMRNGILPRFWATINNSRNRLRISDIEQVETQALRALKRGGNVFYRYRTSVQGKGLRFVFASGGEDYRQMTQHLFTVLPENVLDNRSIELRDYLKDPKETLMKAEFAKIPSVAVLEDLLEIFTKDKKTGKKSFHKRKVSENEEEKAEYLRRLANELRLSGYLLQALEAFRRALILQPKDNWILFEFARCLHSFAGTQHNDFLEKRAIAVLRLVGRRSKNDGELLARLGEAFFQYGESRRAQRAFEKSREIIGENFRAIRGLAEIALREGKIGYVILHFSNANRLADTKSLRRWTNGEAEYFSRLNSDEEYMDLEISRIKLLESLSRTRKSALGLAFLGFPAILFGVIFGEDFIANVGWAVSAIALTIWGILMISQKLFTERIPFHLLDEENS